MIDEHSAGPVDFCSSDSHKALGMPQFPVGVANLLVGLETISTAFAEHGVKRHTYTGKRKMEELNSSALQPFPRHTDYSFHIEYGSFTFVWAVVEQYPFLDPHVHIK